MREHFVVAEQGSDDHQIFDVPASGKRFVNAIDHNKHAQASVKSNENETYSDLAAKSRYVVSVMPFRSWTGKLQKFSLTVRTGTAVEAK